MCLTHPYANPRMAGASDENGAVAVYMWGDGIVSLWTYAPSALGGWKNRENLLRLFRKASEKLSMRRNRES